MIQNRLSKLEVRFVTAHIKDPDGTRFNYSGVEIVDRRSDMDIREVVKRSLRWTPLVIPVPFQKCEMLSSVGDGSGFNGRIESIVMLAS